jgi:tryptophan synthase alpha chain
VTLALGRKYGVCNILLVAPTTSRKRAERIIASSSGFVYYVSLTGVTGVRKNLPPELISNVRSIKLLSDKPVAVGFGISGAKQARRVASIADGAIVGSAIINASSDEKRGSAGLTVLVRKIAGAIHGA